MTDLYFTYLQYQALNRVHRIGQTHNVRCVIFYCRNSCEERILALRQQQNQLTELLANPDEVEVNFEENIEGTPQGGSGVRGVRKEGVSNKRTGTGIGVIVNSTVGGTSGFFTSSQLKLLFGLTLERLNKLVEERLNPLPPLPPPLPIPSQSPSSTMRFGFMVSHPHQPSPTMINRYNRHAHSSNYNDNHAQTENNNMRTPEIIPRNDTYMVDIARSSPPVVINLEEDEIIAFNKLPRPISPTSSSNNSSHNISNNGNSHSNNGISSNNGSNIENPVVILDSDDDI